MPDVSNHGDLWSLLVPVKRLDRAKSRLAVSPAQRAEIALAMAIDTVRAGLSAVAIAEAIVVTDDPRAADALSAIGARVVADIPDSGLNPALRHGASTVTTQRVAALSSDLPALRGADLDAVLGDASAHRRAVVSDMSGTGTTLLAAAVTDFEPAFGVGSLAAHLTAGAVDLSAIAAPGLRHDVDTVQALRAAIGLGVGPETRRAAADLQ
jgi:2-phospho-L-lactate guanylyltransferase